MRHADVIHPFSRNRRAFWRRDRVFMAALLICFVVGLAGLAAATGWRETWAQIARLGPAQLLGLLALSCVNYLLRGLRWHVLARRLGLPLSVERNVIHFLGGFAMIVTPGRVGELVRMRWIARETGWSFDRTAPLALVDRAADLAAMAAILAVVAMATATGGKMALAVAAAGLLAAWIVTHPPLLRALVTGLHATIGRMPRLFGRARRAARAMERVVTPRAMLPVMGLGLLGWLAEGYAFHLLLAWMGADIGVMRAIGIFVFATLAGGLTGAPGGLGGAEAAMIGLLALEGVPMETALPATAIIRATTLWFALAMGLVAFPLAERQSKRGRDVLEAD
ncbi:uncharacterized protein (TIRG00374 family) [Albidovulum inexpectatum]|uniref:Uncharacterized protein (TIRG00374 family) n=1 Tax=Albidovulum inexpectatum TaxID=196587 RepID=A0A2S5JEM3_9RHOB|nr:lysylphosphatidylglycerol synthase transmembrane domain-containing protein [Albidovulum inexpectatum]PPB79849.1 uncharacterized protein (TIRG00374 family) [Albidovulum inexpectatum]